MANRNIARWTTILLMIPVIALVLLAADSTDSFKWLIGKTAPDIHFLKGANGKPGKLSDFRGKTVLVNFWASWCGPCMEEMPKLKKLEEKLGGRGFVVLAINVEEKKESIAKMVNFSALPKNLIFEPSETDLNHYKVQTIPASVLIDSSGVARRGVLGDPDWIGDKTVKSIEKILGHVNEKSGRVAN